nr:sodium-coupled neutral amino acid transporter 2 isoform X2 [Chrysemys picta bellii]
MDRADVSKFNISPDEDSSSFSSNSNDFNYPYPTKAPIRPCVDRDPENQNFLLESNLGKKKYDIEYHPGTTSFGMSAFNLSNVIMGSGILGLSYAMANTGIILFVILLVVVSIFSLYSVHLLLKTANEGGSLLYEQLGMKAFGLAGKIAASGSITMQNIGAMSSYLYIVKYELPLVIKSFMNIEENTGEWYLNGDCLVVLVSIVFILPLSLLKNLGYLGYTSGLSLMCMVFFLIVVICKTFQIPCPLESEYDMMNTTLNGTLAHLATAAPLHGTAQNMTSDDMCRPKYFVFNSQTVYAVPILTFSFVCHPAILPIYEELKGRTRRRMMNVSNISFFAMFVMYLLAALFGYLTFYDPHFNYTAVLCREGVQLVTSQFNYSFCFGIYQCSRNLCPFHSRYIWIHWCLCCCHADLYTSFCFLYQTSEERTSEISAEDWGYTLPGEWPVCDDWKYDLDYYGLDP